MINPKSNSTVLNPEEGPVNNEADVEMISDLPLLQVDELSTYRPWAMLQEEDEIAGDTASTALFGEASTCFTANLQMKSS